MPHGMKSLNYLMDHILYQIAEIILGISSRNMRHETMKLTKSTKIKINKDENGENALHLEITEVILVHCNIVNNKY